MLIPAASVILLPWQEGAPLREHLNTVEPSLLQVSFGMPLAQEIRLILIHTLRCTSLSPNFMHNNTTITTTKREILERKMLAIISLSYFSILCSFLLFLVMCIYFKVSHMVLHSIFPVHIMMQKDFSCSCIIFII